MMAQLGRQHALGQHLLQLRGQAGFPKYRFSVLVFNLGKQLVVQFDGERVCGAVSRTNCNIGLMDRIDLQL